MEVFYLFKYFARVSLYCNSLVLLGENAIKIFYKFPNFIDCFNFHHCLNFNY